MDRLKYSEKCFKMLSTRQFKVVENDLPNHFNQKYNVLLENWNLKSQMKNINTFIRQVKAREVLWYHKNAQTPHEWKS